MAKVSVIIPTYNRERTIENSIGSVLNQTFSDFELIVVDDGSWDNTENIVKGIRDKRVRYYGLRQNEGASNARNVGARLATTNWIAFQDSDDEWDKEKLALQYEYAILHSEVDMVYCGMKVKLKDDVKFFPNEKIGGELEGFIFDWLIRRNTIGTPTMLVKRKEFLESGGFDTSLRCIEDWEFAVRFSECHSIGYIDRALVYTEIKDGGVSSNISGYYETRCKMIAYYYDYLNKGGLFDDVVLDLFTRASGSGVLELVQQMLMQAIITR